MKVTGDIPSQDIISIINSRDVKYNESEDVKRIKDALCIELNEKKLTHQF